MNKKDESDTAAWNSIPTLSPSITCSMPSVYHDDIPRTRRQQIMEKTISDLLTRLDYTGEKLQEMKDHCKFLRSLLDLKNEEIENLNNEVSCLKESKQDIYRDYQDLYSRYQHRVEELKQLKKNTFNK